MILKRLKAVYIYIYTCHSPWDNKTTHCVLQFGLVCFFICFVVFTETESRILWFRWDVLRQISRGNGYAAVAGMEFSGCGMQPSTSDLSSTTLSLFVSLKFMCCYLVCFAYALCDICGLRKILIFFILNTFLLLIFIYVFSVILISINLLRNS